MKSTFCQLTIAASIVEALLTGLGYWGGANWVFHACWCCDIRRGAEASCCSLTLLLLHQHHHPLPPHLHGCHCLPLALSQHLGVHETRLSTNIILKLK